MNELTKTLLRSNGASIEQKIQGIAPDFSIEGFLYGEVGLDHDDADILATEVRSVPVAIALTDAAVLSLDDTPSPDDEVTRLKDLLLPSSDKINIRSGVIEVIRDASDASNPGLFPVNPEQSQHSAVMITLAYELGELLGRKVYGMLDHNFSASTGEIPRNNQEVQTYLAGVIRDILARDSEDQLPAGIEDIEPSSAAITEYFANTRPKRFCAAAGWLLVNNVDRRVATDYYARALRNFHFDNMTTSKQVLPPEDIGALYPLEPTEFDLLCSFIGRDNKLGTSVVTSLEEARQSKTEREQ